MDEEAKWLRRHGAKRRLSQMRERKRRSFNAASATLLRRMIQIVSGLALLLMLVSGIINWSKPGMGSQVFPALLGLSLLNGLAWGMEWLAWQLSGDVKRQ